MLTDLHGRPKFSYFGKVKVIELTKTNQQRREKEASLTFVKKMKGSMSIKEIKDNNVLTSAFIVGYLCHHS